MPKKSLEFGLYNWFPGYGYAPIHPANRREFESLEPHNKVFEKIGEVNGWLLLRYSDEEFKVRPDLFTSIQWLPFTFGEWVRPANQPTGPVAEITDIYWSVSDDAPFFALKQGKRSLEGLYRQEQLRPA
ncbi:hypothetical protein [Rufibacter sp. XAAS-G3-1]|uniref:DUF6960 family protein n=1 Tax=Rufibacter sp. XAAS-G3-1 TaxID=2729134 RepID=UPI0015E70699|nr:hypothetical protein [Rufibacter sp. XAAS-G3-1]